MAARGVSLLQPMVSSYDVQAVSQRFHRRFPSLQGEFYATEKNSLLGEGLPSLGFRQKTDIDVSVGRGVNTMAIVLCDLGQVTQLRAKRKGLSALKYVPNGLQVANKLRLLLTVTDFERRSPHLVPRGLEAASLMPPTVALGTATKEHIRSFLQSQEMFLVKPASADRGEGIRLFRSDGKLQSLFKFLEKHYRRYRRRGLLLQQYVERPLLLGGRKFDLRVYLLVVANSQRTGVYGFVHPGYVRCTCRPYSAASDDMKLHISSIYQQCKDEMYEAVKDERVWPPDELNDYLNANAERLGAPCRDWASRRLYPRIRAVLAYLVSVVSASMGSTGVDFELFGVDFVVDADYNVKLLELNRTPALMPQPPKTLDVVKEAVMESTALVAEVLQLTHRQRGVRRLVTLQNFRKVYSHENEQVVRRVMREAGLRWPRREAE